MESAVGVNLPVCKQKRLKRRCKIETVEYSAPAPHPLTGNKEKGKVEPRWQLLKGSSYRQHISTIQESCRLHNDVTVLCSTWPHDNIRKRKSKQGQEV